MKTCLQLLSFWMLLQQSVLQSLYDKQADCRRFLQWREQAASEKFSVIITGSAKPPNLIRGCEGRVEDVYQRDTGHNALCLIG